MVSKREVKYIQSLCQKKHRAEERLFIVEGEKAVEELIQSDWTIRQLYAAADWMAAHLSLNLPVQEASEEQLQQMSGLRSARAVIALVEMPNQQELPLQPDGFTLVLDQLQDPGNMGTILRIADWFGIQTIVASESCADLYNPKVIQSSMGSFLRVQVHYTDLTAWLEQYRAPILGAVLTGESVFMASPHERAALIIGNEGQGIGQQLLPFIQEPVSIPRLGKAESLNAAVATGILLSYLKRK
jgi:TrmH family RNA methyltransferase